MTSLKKNKIILAYISIIYSFKRSFKVLANA